MADFPDHPFWDFSLDVYMTKGVGPACVVVQESLHLDVNIVLFCTWVGASGRGAMTAAEIDAATAAVHPWHEDIVRNLRAVRTRMKGGMPPAPDDLSESLRQRIQKIEIDCEHTEQLMLAGSIDRAADDTRPAEARAADAADNIAAYLRTLGGEVAALDRENFAVILRVAFPDVDAARVDELCERIGG